MEGPPLPLLVPALVDVELDDAGGIPRRDNEVTEYPSNRARRQMVCPKNPVPPKTSNFPFLSVGVLLLMLVLGVGDIHATTPNGRDNESARSAHQKDIHRGTFQPISIEVSQ